MDLFSLSLVAPAGTVNVLALFQVLVVDEEVLDLILEEIGHVGDVLDVVVAWVVENGEQLVVAAGFVGHLENTDDSGLNHNCWKNGLGEDDQCIQWVAVFAEGVVDVAVVQWVCHWSEQVAVEVDLSGLVVDFVLVA